MEFETERELSLFKAVEVLSKRKPCDICGNDLEDEFLVRKKPFSLSLERRCKECK